MLKHIPSNADVDMLIDDQGNIFVFCKQLNKVWTGRFVAMELPPSTLGAADTMKALKNAARTSRVALESIGMGSDLIDALLR